MAQIPGVPDIEPVQANPRAFSRGGEAIAGMGEDIQGIALSGLQIENHIREAKKHVDTLTFSNQANAIVEQTRIDLEKTTDSSQAKTVSDQGIKNLNDLVTQWTKAGSPAAPELGLYAQSLTPSLNFAGQQRELKLMAEKLHVETVDQLKTLLPLAVTAHRSGDKSQEQAVFSHVSDIFDNGIQTGLITPSGKKHAMEEFQENFRKELNDAAIKSVNPAERKQAIAQATKGGSGPLDLTGMTEGEKDALRISAQDWDKKITDQAEVMDTNGSLNHFYDIIKSDPALKDNPAGAMKVVTDGDWLVKNGFVDENGKPNRVLADKVLIPEINRQWALKEKEESDKAQKLEEHWLPLAEQGKVSRGQAGLIASESPKASSAIMHAVIENERYNKQIAAIGRAAATEERKTRSAERLNQIFLDSDSGKPPSKREILEMPGLTKEDQVHAVAYVNSIDKDPILTPFLKQIDKDGMFPDDSEGVTKRVVTKNAMIQYRNTHPNASSVELGAQMEELLSDTNQEAIGKALDEAHARMTGTPTEKSGFWSRFTSGNSTGGGLPGSKGSSTKGGTMYARDPQGKLHKAPAGSQLPEGWTVEK